MSKTKKQDIQAELPPEPEKTADAYAGEDAADAPSGTEPQEAELECGGCDTQCCEDSDKATALEGELAAERDKYLRLAAEYDNFRKRSQKEREALYNDIRADTITRLLPVYDNLARALETECSDEAYYKGVEMTMTQLTEILENMGVTQIPAVGEVFDPNRHNAVMRVEDPELGGNVITREFEKGFMLGDKVIRFSTVAVAT